MGWFEHQHLSQLSVLPGALPRSQMNWRPDPALTPTLAFHLPLSQQDPSPWLAALVILAPGVCQCPKHCCRSTGSQKDGSRCVQCGFGISLGRFRADAVVQGKMPVPTSDPRVFLDMGTEASA